MKGKATSFDIAYKAGVSQSTVSRALRNSPLVNDQTKKKIQIIAKELNYKVDKNASNLRSQHSDTLALLLFDDPTVDNSSINPFFYSIMSSITRTCAKKNYDLLVSFQQFSEDWHADYEDTKRADGIILLGYGDYLNQQFKLQYLQEKGTNFIVWGATSDNNLSIVVNSDNFQGGYILTKHLLQSGRKQCVFLGNASHNAPEFYARYQGYLAALAEFNLTSNQTRQFNAISTEYSGYTATQALLASQLPFDAIVCGSDLIAIGALRALQEKKYQVGKQIAVVGFDNIPLAQFISPQLTTIEQNTSLGGELLVNILLQKIQGKTVESIKIPTKLVIRESCGTK